MRACLRRVARLGLSFALSASVAVAQPASARFEGRRLEDALRALQALGLRIIFSSQVVTRDMRVLTEPRARDSRRLLDELLSPHGLVAVPGPAGVILVIRDRQAGRAAPVESGTPRPPQKPDDTARSQTLEATHTERVTVTASRDEGWAHDVGSGVTLRGDELLAVSRGLFDDPLRTLQALPHVATGDDFRSEFSVRASPYRHVGIVVDGVATPWLQHGAPGRTDTGTVTMLGSEVIEEATLQAGAYPRRHGDRLGAQVELALREGSRVAPRFRATATRTMTGATAEGPLGTGARGSWLLAVRKSHLEWPVSRTDHEASVFGLADALGRIVYDLSPTQQLGVSLLAGQSSLEHDDPDPAALAGGSNRTALLSVGWRWLVGTGLVVQQRVAAVAHDFRNFNQARAVVGAGENTDFVYRADAARAVFGGVLETGAHVERRHAFRRGTADSASEYGAPVVDWGRGTGLGAWATGAYAHYRWGTPRLTLAPGLRVTGSTQVDRPAVDRWVQAEWRMGPAWRLHGSAGLVHQLPEADHVRAWTAGLPPERVALRPERALHIDVGIEQHTTANVVWRVTAFSRAEDDILRRRERVPATEAGRGFSIAGPAGFENALSGLARGVEVSVERRAGVGLDGWIGYAFGTAQYTDRALEATFWADFDQRHSISAAALYRLRTRLSLGATFKAGSSVPIPGGLGPRHGALYAVPDRDQGRLPPYARLDLRAERTFTRGGRRLTLFAEIVNVLDRTNLWLADGLGTPTGEAGGFTQRLDPRLLSGGVRVEF